MEALSHWQSLSNYHRRAKFKGITYQRLPYTRTTKIGFMAYWVQFWYPLSAPDVATKLSIPFQATTLSFLSHLLFNTKLKKYYQTTNGQQEKNKLIGIPNSNFSFHNDLLYHDQRLYIPLATNLYPSILHEFHETPSAGHSDLKATLARLVTSFYWPGMYRDTQLFIKSASPANKTNPSTKNP